MKFIRLFFATFPIVLLVAGCQDNSSTDEKLNQAFNHARYGDWKSAEKIAAEISETYPQAVQPMLILALAFEKRGELDKAIDLARQAADAAPKDFTAQYTYGRLCASTPRRQAEAYTVLENALKLKAEDTNTLVLLCSIGIQRNEPSTDQYLNLLTHKPDFSRSAELYFMLGSRQAQKGNRDAAKRFMLDALNKCGGNRNPDFHYHIARCFDRNRFPANEIKQRYNLYLRIPGKKNPEYIADAGKRLRQLNSVR